MLNIEKEREAFSNWHESEYGEHVTWWDGVPASHIHNDRWSGWKASALRAAEKLEGCVVVPVEPTKEMAAWILCEHDIADNLYQAGVFYKEFVVEAARGGDE